MSEVEDLRFHLQSCLDSLHKGGKDVEQRDCCSQQESVCQKKSGVRPKNNWRRKTEGEVEQQATMMTNNKWREGKGGGKEGRARRSVEEKKERGERGKSEKECGREEREKRSWPTSRVFIGGRPLTSGEEREKWEHKLRRYLRKKARRKGKAERQNKKGKVKCKAKRQAKQGLLRYYYIIAANKQMGAVWDFFCQSRKSLSKPWFCCTIHVHVQIKVWWRARPS